MPIAEDDYNTFIEKWDKIASRYPIVLHDRDRFLNELSNDQTFINENYDQYLKASFYVTQNIYYYAEKISPGDLESYLAEFESFVEKWQTRPVSCWLFDDSTENIVEAMELFFDERDLAESIKIYPWTTKKEINSKFEDIRSIQKPWPLQNRSPQYGIRFKIKALRDARWGWSEIVGHLKPKSITQQEIDCRKEELKKQGKTATEIEYTLDHELLPDTDAAFEDEIKEDTARKRYQAIKKECDRLETYLKIGR